MKDLLDFIKGFDFHTIIIVGIAFFYLNSNMNGNLEIIQKDVSLLKNDMSELKTDMAVIRAVLVMKNIMPIELAANQNKEIL